MDSEVHEFTASLVGAPIAEKQPTIDACDEMPTVSTNGISNLSASGIVINFIDEEQEQMGDVQEAASVSSYAETQPNESQDGVETLEETEIIEKNDIIDEEYEEEEEEVEEQEQEEEDEGDDEFAEEDLEGEILPQKECAQVPKKRKFAPTEAAGAENAIDTAAEMAAEGEEDDEDQEALVDEDGGEFIEEDNAEEAVLPDDGQHEEDEDELPTSSARAAANKENTVDEESCRVCTTKENLISLFKYVEQQTVAEMLMTICPNVSIACKDFMPQFVCQRCLDNVTIAVQLKSQCESTERELRKKLSRHKNKVRRPSGYVVIDAPVESEPEEEEEEPADDVEFKVSDVEVSASADESYTEEDSDFDEKKRRGRRGGRKSTSKTKKGTGGRSLKRTANSTDEEGLGSSKKKKDNNNSTVGNRAYEFQCDECDQVFSRKLSLVLHKKTHSQGPPIICKLCGKHFKMQGSYRSHMERHKNEKNHYSCGKCDYFFSTKGELRKHQLEEHNEGDNNKTTPTYKCKKCQRTFLSQARLSRHMEGLCHGMDTAQKIKRAEYENYSSGRDLFKAVAPLTTTYWSDSFSD